MCDSVFHRCFRKVVKVPEQYSHLLQGVGKHMVQSLLALHFPDQQGSMNLLTGSRHPQIEGLHCPDEPTQVVQIEFRWYSDEDSRVRADLQGSD